jgi:hypothetical protein
MIEKLRKTGTEGQLKEENIFLFIKLCELEIIAIIDLIYMSLDVGC